ncbi:hypothetical protein GQ600_12681 [Phytophthora cactorum]|nr:hypothetical protein GQ600_12681 [Phytophthora cactorum]
MKKPLYHYCLAAFRLPLTLLKGVLASPGRITGKNVTVCCRSRWKWCYSCTKTVNSGHHRLSMRPSLIINMMLIWSTSSSYLLFAPCRCHYVWRSTSCQCHYLC